MATALLLVGAKSQRGLGYVMPFDQLSAAANPAAR
jgi:hypothetical protein